MTYDSERAAEYEFEVRRPGVEFEFTRETDDLEQREIDRRVRWALERREAADSEGV